MAIVENLKAINSVGISSENRNWADRSGTVFPLCESTGTKGDIRSLLIQFAQPSADNLFREITRVTLLALVTSHSSNPDSHPTMQYAYLKNKFDPVTVTFNNAPEYTNFKKYWINYDPDFNGSTADAFKGEGLAELFQNGLNCWAAHDGYVDLSIHTSRASFKPELQAFFGDYVQAEIYSITPESYTVVNSSSASDFTLQLRTLGHCAGIIRPVKTTLKWREHGSSNVHSKISTGNVVTLEANTLTEGEVEYSFTVETNNGQRLSSEWKPITVVSPKLKIISTSPSAGSTLDKSGTNIFTVSTEIQNEIHPGDLTFTAAKFRWRNKENLQINELDFDKTSSNISVPPNTFTAGDFEYSFHIETNYGQTIDSEWVSFTTGDTIPTVRLLRPDGGMVDANKDITLAWVHVNASGTQATKADINLVNEDTQEVHDYMINGSESSYLIPKGTLSTGIYSWKVRSYNIDNLCGPWSNPYKFVVVGAPPAPPVILEDSSPRPVISWQPKEQAGYQIQVDDEPIESYYGLKTSWRCGKYLPDGPHRIRVRVQNKFSLWSTWQTVTVNIKNVPGESFLMYDLCYPLDFTPQISWDVRGKGYDFILIYRNGIPIAKFTEPYGILMDYNVSGTPLYLVRAGYNNSGNYRDAFCSPYGVPSYPKCPVIRTLEDTDWLELPLSDDQYREFSLHRSHEVNTYRLSGHEYPVCEPTIFKTKEMSFSAASDDKEWKARLESMDGKIVCVKLPSGDSIIGPLDLAIRHSEFYSVYVINVTQIDFKEEIPLDS